MARARLSGSVIWFTALLFAFVTGCRADADQAYLRLSWEDFDQNPTGGWRPLADQGNYAGAALMIETYLDRRDDLLPAQRGYSLFHAGQLRALRGDTERALAHLDHATVAEMPPEFPRSFNSLVVGTRGFLRDDMATVRAARDEVAALPGLAPRDSMFLDALNLLARSEGLTYLEVYHAAVE